MLAFAIAAGALPFLPAAVGQVGWLPHHSFRARFTIGVGELVDLLTPFAVVGTAALALVVLGVGAGLSVLAAAGAVAYVGGHGMHLAANAIPRDELAHTAALRVVDFWDERFSHAWWHAGLLALLAVFSLARPKQPLQPMWLAGTVALLGPSLFVQAIEGGSWWLVLGALPLFVVGAVARPDRLSAACAGVVVLASLGIALWAAWWRGLPQPSDLV